MGTLDKLLRVRTTCHRFQISLKPQKCKLRYYWMNHLGRVLKDDTMSLEAACVASVDTSPELRSKKQGLLIRRFSQFVLWMRNELLQSRFPIFGMLRKIELARFDSSTVAQ